MKKLTLDLDTLSVDSFPTSSADETARGTVRGHDTIESEWCTMPKTCSRPPCNTEGYTCATC